VFKNPFQTERFARKKAGKRAFFWKFTEGEKHLTRLKIGTNI